MTLRLIASNYPINFSIQSGSQIVEIRNLELEHVSSLKILQYVEKV